VQVFLSSPQALTLAALRIIVDHPNTLVQLLKADGAVSVLLGPLAHALADNVAVLTGRAPATFTDRVNSCMWCVHVDLPAWCTTRCILPVKSYLFWHRGAAVAVNSLVHALMFTAVLQAA
jgi:hypothetical protein